MPTKILLIIDVQRSIVDLPNPIPSSAAVLQNLTTILTRARKTSPEVKIIWVRHNDPSDPEFTPHTPPWELMTTAAFSVADDEPIVEKTTRNSFYKTSLADEIAGYVDDEAALEITLVGVQSDFCVRATAKAAVEGYPSAKVRLVSGAHGTYDDGEKSAEVVEREIEDELREVGVEIIGIDEVGY